MSSVSGFNRQAQRPSEATLAEVAKRAGVSTATVSRVLNGSAVVRENTKRKVLHTVEEMKYQPNLHARTLARGSSRTIGMIVSNIENPFFLDIFRSTEAIALDRGYSVLLEQTGYTASRLVASVRSMLGRRVCGLSVIVSEMEPGLVDELSQREIPVVIYDVGHPARNISSIRVRYEIGIQRVVEYLYSLGHRRMAFVGHHARLAPLQARRKTFIKAVRKFASGADYTIVEESDTPAGGRHATHRLLESGFAPTAILCVNDIMAVGVLRELRERGLRVPEDVSVTGFDNIQLAEYTSPALTTVNIPRAEIGRYCFEAIAPLDGVLGIDRDVVIYPELVVRESTGRAQGAAL